MAPPKLVVFVKRFRGTCGSGAATQVTHALEGQKARASQIGSSAEADA